MPTTVPTATTTERPLGNGQLAALLVDAANLIDTAGINRGGYWPNDLAFDYGKGQPLDAVGALAVAAGITKAAELEHGFLGMTRYDPTHHTQVDTPQHPVVTVLVEHLGLTVYDELFAWSDDRTAAQVVVEMRVCAAKLRITEQAGQ